ncbi:hypothetical protein GS891_12610 [Rhodococcus hoagii]|nr:hypothetical protein [Prescottella equi]
MRPRGRVTPRRHPRQGTPPRRRHLRHPPHPDLWFSNSDIGRSAAQRICAGCPVATGCRSAAHTAREQHGVWAGESERQRLGEPKVGRPRPTRCPKEHEFTDDNTYTNPSGHRICLTCRRENDRIRRENRKAIA